MKIISSAPFTKCTAHINDEHVDNADNLDIAMPTYKLTEYSNKYSDIYGSLKEMNRLLIMMQILSIFLQLIQHPLNTIKFSRSINRYWR